MPWWLSPDLHLLGESAISPLLPNGIYTIPEVSMVGETEQSLKKKGVAYIVGRATEVVHIGLVAMMCNATASLFMDACFNLPTLGLLYKTATLNALGLNSISPSSPAG